MANAYDMRGFENWDAAMSIDEEVEFALFALWDWWKITDNDDRCHSYLKALKDFVPQNKIETFYLDALDQIAARNEELLGIPDWMETIEHNFLSLDYGKQWEELRFLLDEYASNKEISNWKKL